MSRSVEELVTTYQSKTGGYATRAAQVISAQVGAQRIQRGYQGKELTQAEPEAVQYAALRDAIDEEVAQYDGMFSNLGNLFKLKPGPHRVIKLWLLEKTARGAAVKYRQRLIRENLVNIDTITDEMSELADGIYQKFDERLTIARQMKQAVKERKRSLKDDYLKTLRETIDQKVDSTELKARIAEHEAEIGVLDLEITKLEGQAEEAYGKKDIAAVKDITGRLENLYVAKRGVVDDFELVTDTDKEVRREALVAVDRINMAKAAYKKAELNEQAIDAMIDADTLKRGLYKNLKDLMIPEFKESGRIARMAEEATLDLQLYKSIAKVHDAITKTNATATMQAERNAFEMFRNPAYDPIADEEVLQEIRRQKLELIEAEEEFIAFQSTRNAVETKQGTKRIGPF
jgi:hypothetical protein